jgi:hypothetical protein
LSHLAVFTSVRSASMNLPGKARAQRTLALAGIAHALHDGLTDMIYVLLPVWQSQFALSYGALAMLRALCVGSQNEFAQLSVAPEDADASFDCDGFRWVRANCRGGRCFGLS